MPERNMRVFKIGPDYVVAESIPHALRVAMEAQGYDDPKLYEKEVVDGGPKRRVHQFERIKIRDDSADTRAVVEATREHYPTTARVDVVVTVSTVESDWKDHEPAVIASEEW